MITDEFLEQISREIYAERHKTNPELYYSPDWDGFKETLEGQSRYPVWMADVRLGLEVIFRVLKETGKLP